MLLPYPVCTCPPFWPLTHGHAEGCPWLQPMEPLDRYETAFPRNQAIRGVDAGARPQFPLPCAKRLNHYRTITWCSLPTAHEGECSGPQPRALEINTKPKGMR
jgi:hypothetical protein